MTFSLSLSLSLFIFIGISVYSLRFLLPNFSYFASKFFSALSPFFHANFRDELDYSVQFFIFFFINHKLKPYYTDRIRCQRRERMTRIMYWLCRQSVWQIIKEMNCRWQLENFQGANGIKKNFSGAKMLVDFYVKICLWFDSVQISVVVNFFFPL